LTRTLQNRLKRQKAKRQTIFLVLGCSLVIGLVLLVFALTSEKYPDDGGGGKGYAQVEGELIEYEPEAETESADAPPLTLGIGGDVTFGLAVADIIALQGDDYPWSDVSTLFGDYDLSVVNLEGPLCQGATPVSDISDLDMRGEASCALPMAAAGVDAVCLANDHIMDYGSSGLEETLNLLRGEGLETFGAGSSGRAAERSLVLDADNGASVSMLAFCDVAPTSHSAGDDSPGISTSSLESMGDVIGLAAEETPYVVVFMHWGELGSQEITPRQRELAQACVQAGADLVVGCHPHVVQGIEVIEGVPVIYSLGNLVYSSESDEGKNGIFVGCRFSGGELATLEIIPLRVAEARPYPMPQEQAESLLRELDEASSGVALEISPVTGTATLKP
jgi:hypothetical protein